MKHSPPPVPIAARVRVTRSRLAKIAIWIGGLGLVSPVVGWIAYVMAIQKTLFAIDSGNMSGPEEVSNQIAGHRILLSIGVFWFLPALGLLLWGLLAGSEEERKAKAAQPGATDNPGDAQ